MNITEYQILKYTQKEFKYILNIISWLYNFSGI